MIISGASYEKESDSFYSCSNVNVIQFETTPTFGGIIKSFNITTNTFAAKYVFKRLKFLGFRPASHFFTLLFLALWHGWATGYYVTFAMEFLIMKLEWEVRCCFSLCLDQYLKLFVFQVLTIIESMRRRNKVLDQFLSAFYIRWPLYIFFRIYTIIMFGYCLVPFTLLSFHKWYPVLSQIYFIGHVIYLSWFFVSFFLPKIEQWRNIPTKII